MPKPIRPILTLMIALLLFTSTGQPSGLVHAHNLVDSTGSDFVPGELVVGLADGYEISNIQSSLSAGRMSLAATPDELTQELNVSIISVPVGGELAARDALLKSPAVLFAEPNYYVTADFIPNDTHYTEQYGPALVNAPDAWDATTGSADVILAVIDSGLDAGHPEFAGRVLSGKDYVDGSLPAQDACGHGTHVAGIAAAAGNNAQGVAGIAWNIKILPVRVLDKTCGGSFADVAAAILWSVNHGADVINLSLGSASPSTLMENATYWAYDRGVTVVSSAGNSGGTPIYYPARYPWVISVGSVDSATVRAASSSYGSDLDLMAPGVDVFSTTPRTAFELEKAPYHADRTYGYLSGTSMAAPHVSGAVALMLSAYPAKFDHPDKVTEALTATAQDLEAAGKDNNTGYGLLQIAAALAYTPTITPPPAIIPTVDYDVVSSTLCHNVVYQWVDATIGGTLLFIPETDGYLTVNLPFTYTFGGVDYTQATVSANGYLTFGGYGGQPVNSFIPGIAEPNNFIAPFWDDLTPSANEDARIFVKTMGSAPYRSYVVEWYKLNRQPAMGEEVDSLLTFELILYEAPGSAIRVQYASLSGNLSSGGSATVGVEYLDGKAGSTYSYNQSGKLQSQQAILFVPVPYGTNRVTSECNYTALVGSQGGHFDLPPWCLDLPKDALAEDTTLHFNLLAQFTPPFEGWMDLNHFTEIYFDPSAGTLNTPAIVCYHYTADDVLKAGGHAENLYIARYHGGRWDTLPTYLDTANGLLTARVSDFSVFNVVTSLPPEELPVTGASRQPWLPAGAASLLALMLAGLLWRNRSR